MGAGFSHIKFIYQAIVSYISTESGAELSTSSVLSHENCSLNYACSCNSLSFKFDQSPLGCQKLCKKKFLIGKLVGNRLRRPTTSSVFTFRFFNHSFFFSPTKIIHLSLASIERTLIYGTP